jgi:hypothetical protein
MPRVEHHADRIKHHRESSVEMSTTEPHSLTEPPVSLSTNARIFNQPAPILDFVWYPTASPQNPASFCFIASVRECPVKLLDASDGRVSPPRFRFLLYLNSAQVAPGIIQNS